MEQENNYLLYGHLGGVMYLTTNTLGDTLVSVGQDRVAKLWRAKPQMSHNSPAILQPVRQPFTSHYSDILSLFGHSRWFSLNYNISAVSLSSDSSRLVVALSTRIQEVEMESEVRELGGRERLYRQSGAVQVPGYDVDGASSLML